MSHNTHNPNNGPNRASQVTPGETPDTAAWAEKYLDAAHENNSPKPGYKPYRKNDEYADNLDPAIEHPNTRLQGVK